MRRSWTAIVVGAISALSSGQGDASAASVGPEPDRRIAVRVDDKAGLQGDQLQLAKARAAEVFSVSGLGVEWVDEGEAAGLNLTATYTIVIMADAPAALKEAAMEGKGADVMGQSVPCIRRAYVYYGRVLKVRPSFPRDIVSTLGDVMAHELGHLMLPPGHSGLGIMRRSIDMSSRQVETFTEAEVAEIHANLERSRHR